MDLKKNFGLSSEYGLYFEPSNPNKLNLIRYFNALYEEKLDLSEKIRLFYVALTRTREKMIFLYPLDEKEYSAFQNSGNVNQTSLVYDEIKSKFIEFKNGLITLSEFEQFVDRYNYEHIESYCQNYTVVFECKHFGCRFWLVCGLYDSCGNYHVLYKAKISVD